MALSFRGTQEILSRMPASYGVRKASYYSGCSQYQWILAKNKQINKHLHAPREKVWVQFSDKTDYLIV